MRLGSLWGRGLFCCSHVGTQHQHSTEVWDYLPLPPGLLFVAVVQRAGVGRRWVAFKEEPLQHRLMDLRSFILTEF